MIDFKALQAPIPKHLVKVKTTRYKDKRTGAQKEFSVSHITARTVMNRLDEVCGPENWYTSFSSKDLPPNTIRCTIYIRVNDEWLGKSDIGTATDVEPEKGMVSTSIKRAAVHWGIARELYGEGTADLDDDETEDEDEYNTQPAPPSAHRQTYDDGHSDEFPTIRQYWPGVANSLLALPMDELPEGLAIGVIVGAQAEALGYEDYNAVKQALGLKSSRHFGDTFESFLNAVLKHAPKYNEVV